jgi:Domain of unknown function (DUF202)
VTDHGVAGARTRGAWQRTGLSLVSLSLLVLHLQVDALGLGLVLLIPPFCAGALLVISPLAGPARTRVDGVAPALAATGVVAIALVTLVLASSGNWR